MFKLHPRNLQLATLLSRLGEVQPLQPPHPPPNLPNLQFQNWLGQDPIDIHYFGLGSGAQFAPDIEILVHYANTGLRDAGPFDIVAEVMTNCSGVAGDGTRTITVDNLPAGAIDMQQITVLTNIPLNQFCGVSVQVWLDRPTPDHAWGQVMESNETDNYASSFLGFPPYVPVPEHENGS
jgi:hypothetical protein